MSWFNDRHSFLLAVIFYGASALYSVFLWRKGFRRDEWLNFSLFAAGVALHTAALFRRGLSLQSCPINNLYEAITFLLWTLGLVCLGCALAPRARFLCAFAAPLMFTVGLFALMPSLDPPHGPKPVFSGALRSLHAATTLQAYGVFGLAAVAAAMFLAQQRDLKARRPRALLARLPAMERLERIMFWLAAAGFILLTIGLLAGGKLVHDGVRAYWELDLAGPNTFASSPAAQRMGQVFMYLALVGPSAVLWLIYLETLTAYKFSRCSGRRLAIKIIIAFVLLLLAFGITHPFMKKQEARGVGHEARGGVASASSFVTRHPSPVPRRA